jgi:hypothetical protein
MLNLFQHPWRSCCQKRTRRGELPWMLKQVQHDGCCEGENSEEADPAFDQAEIFLPDLHRVSAESGRPAHRAGRAGASAWAAGSWRGRPAPGSPPFPVADRRRPSRRGGAWLLRSVLQGAVAVRVKRLFPPSTASQRPPRACACAQEESVTFVTSKAGVLDEGTGGHGALALPTIIPARFCSPRFTVFCVSQRLQQLPPQEPSIMSK